MKATDAIENHNSNNNNLEFLLFQFRDVCHRPQITKILFFRFFLCKIPHIKRNFTQHDVSLTFCLLCACVYVCSLVRNAVHRLCTSQNASKNDIQPLALALNFRGLSSRLLKKKQSKKDGAKANSEGCNLIKTFSFFSKGSI